MANPYSTPYMAERIDALVDHRKPFVVMEEYYGPDRRNANARADDPGTVEVPNALPARVKKRPALSPNSRMIESSMGKLRRVKVRNVARRIWAI
ncbi:MAG: hypothetical protein VCE75_07225 [Alphaproteobacteria bacterium]